MVPTTQSKIQESEARRSSVNNSAVSGNSRAIERSNASKERDTSAVSTERSKSTKAETISKAAPKQGGGLKSSVADGWHSLEYENGYYEGDLKNNKRHGKGRYTWKDGNWYEGDWVDDLKEGTGKFCWTTGDNYEGEYRKDKRDGVGIKVYTNGDRYEVVI